jgi:hypothetical protein
MYEEELHRVYKYVVSSIYATWQPHERYRDAIQEGVIRAWELLEAGTHTFPHICRLAKMQAISYLMDPSLLPTGGAKRSREGITRQVGRDNFSRVAKVCKTYLKTHNRYPNWNEVAEETGLARVNATEYIKKVREGAYEYYSYGYIHEERQGNTRIRQSVQTNYAPGSILPKDKGTEYTDYSQFRGLGSVLVTSPIDKVDSNLWYASVVARLSEDNQRVANYWFVQDMSDPQQAKALYGEGAPPFKGQGARIRLVKELKALQVTHPEVFQDGSYA